MNRRDFLKKTTASAALAAVAPSVAAKALVEPAPAWPQSWPVLSFSVVRDPIEPHPRKPYYLVTSGADGDIEYVGTMDMNTGHTDEA